MLQFDAATRKILDTSYLGADFTRRRMENMAALAPRPGQTLLDLGCGQGLLTVELARAVGPDGTVIGVDPSAEMRRAAEARCAAHPEIRILDGAAGALPLPDAALDGALALQVFEYLADIPQALADLRRVLRPGARLVIGDMQFATLSFASDAPDRMARVCAAWDHHVADPNVPARLPAALAAAGFTFLELRPLTFSATTLRPDSLAFMMLHLMRRYVVETGHVGAEEAEAWHAEQQRLSDAGRFFFSVTHFIATALRP